MKDKIKPILIEKKSSEIIFRIGIDDMVYKKDINSFIKETGVTIQNISFPIEGIYLNLVDIGKNFSCGHIIENVFSELKRRGIENTLIVINFDEIEELGEDFYKSYTKVLLETSNKIITINMNTALSNEFGNFILTNIIESIETSENDVEE